MSTLTEAKLRASQPADSVALIGQPYVVHNKDGDDSSEETIAQAAVIGTYAYQQDNATSDDHDRRHGTMDLIQVCRTTRKTRDDDLQYEYSLSTRSVCKSPAVLDLISLRSTTNQDTERNNRVRDEENCEEDTVLYAACADATLIRAYPMQSSYDSLRCKELESQSNSAQDEDSSKLNLSVHAIRDMSRDGSTLVVTSDSDGDVTLRSIGEDGMEVVDKRKMHDGEAWTSHIGRIGESHRMTIMSGGDDGVFTSFIPNDPQACWRLRKAHDCVGVTTIATVQTMPNHIWTGGYDDTVRVWDVRQMRTSVAQHNVHGGVWRIRFHPNDPNLVLVAAMYHGCTVVRWHDSCKDDESGHLTTVCEYDGHESIAYGAEWVPQLEGNRQNSANGCRRLAVTASFYDKAVRLWSFNNE